MTSNPFDGGGMPGFGHGGVGAVMPSSGASAMPPMPNGGATGDSMTHFVMVNSGPGGADAGASQANLEALINQGGGPGAGAGAPGGSAGGPAAGGAPMAAAPSMGGGNSEPGFLAKVFGLINDRSTPSPAGIPNNGGGASFPAGSMPSLDPTLINKPVGTQ
ncbi:MAG: hypothetical protein ACPGOY_03440 [Rhodospirillaceae bacterium]